MKSCSWSFISPFSTTPDHSLKFKLPIPLGEHRFKARGASNGRERFGDDFSGFRRPSKDIISGFWDLASVELRHSIARNTNTSIAMLANERSKNLRRAFSGG